MAAAEGNGDFYEHSFSSYQSDSIDPSPWALIVVSGFCVVLILLLPLAVAILQRWRKRNRVFQQDIQKKKHDFEPPVEPAAKARNFNRPAAFCADESVEVASFIIPRRTSNRTEEDDFFNSIDNPFCYIEEDSTFNALYNGEEDDDEDDESLYGLRQEQAEDDRWVDDDPLPARPSNGFRRAKGMASLFKRGVGKSSAQRRPESCKTEESQTSYLSMMDRSNAQHPPLVVDEGDIDDDNFLSYSSSSSEGDGMDLIKQLVDDFDKFNGIKDGLKSNTSTSAAAETPIQPIHQQPVAPSTNKYDIDLCFGKRPWYAYYLSRGFLHKLWKCISWDGEMRTIARLVVPYSIHAATTHVFELMEIVVIGQLITGDKPTLLGAYFAVEFVLKLATMLLDGVINSLAVVCSRAAGSRNFELAGKYVQLAMLVHQIAYWPIVVICWNRIHIIVRWLGFAEEDALEAQAYSRLAFPTVAVGAFNAALHHVLNLSGFEWYSSLVDMTHSFVSLAGVFVFGWLLADTPLWTVGLVHLTVVLAVGLMNVSVIICKQWFLGFWSGLGSCAVRDGPTVRTFFKTATPLSIGHVVEYCQWEILFVFAAAQGPAEIAVWGLLGSIWEFSEHIGQAIADAAEVRVAHLLECRRPAVARYSSHKSLLLAVLASFTVSGVIIGVRGLLPGWLTTDNSLQYMLRDLLPLVCVGLIALTLGSMSWTILCAQGRMRLATAVTVLGSVLVALPLAAVSTFALNFNLQGLLASIVIGYALSGIINSFIMLTSKWERISEKASKPTKAEYKNPTPPQTQTKQTQETVPTKQTQEMVPANPPIEVELSPMNETFISTLDTTRETIDADEESDSSYEDLDWEALPDKVQNAAKTLGYNQRKWNDCIPTKYDDYAWSDLSPEQQEAALILGYSESRWEKWDNGMADC